MAVARIENNTVIKSDSYPKVWGQSINIKRTAEEWKAYGFYPVVEPPTSEYQSLINLEPSDFDSQEEIFVHRIYNYTAEEIQEVDQSILDNDIYSQECIAEEEDGRRFFRRIKALIKRRVADNTITVAQGKGFRRNF